jgi:hypothetical protein
MLNTFMLQKIQQEASERTKHRKGKLLANHISVSISIDTFINAKSSIKLVIVEMQFSTILY